MTFTCNTRDELEEKEEGQVSWKQSPHNCSLNTERFLGILCLFEVTG